MSKLITKSTSKKSFKSAEKAFSYARRQNTPAGVNVLRVGRGPNVAYIVASTPWAYRLQQQGRGTIVLESGEKSECQVPKRAA